MLNRYASQRRLKFSAFVLSTALVAMGCGDSDVRDNNQELATATSSVEPELKTTSTAGAATEWVTDTFAGAGPTGVGMGGFEDGPVEAAQFNEPADIAMGPDGALYVTDTLNRRIRRVADGLVSTVAGSGAEGIEDGPALQPSFLLPAGIAVAPDGTIYVSDAPAHRIRGVTPDGEVFTLAGGGHPGLGEGELVDGTGVEARFSLPAGLALDADGNVIVADKDNHAIRRVTPDGHVTTLAGTGAFGHEDGEAESAQFAAPVSVAVAEDGSIFVLEHGNNAVRKIDPTGVVVTLFGGGALRCRRAL